MWMVEGCKKAAQEASLARKKVFTETSTILAAVKLQRNLPIAPGALDERLYM
jgi:hypothetical protein